MSKPFKTLKDTYTSIENASVPPLKRHSIINGIKNYIVEAAEAATRNINVIAQKPGSNQEVLGYVDDKGLKQISSIIKADSGFEVLKKLQNLSGFKQGLSFIENDLFFSKNDPWSCNTGECENLVKAKQNGSHIVLSNVINNDKGEINLRDLFLPTIQKLITEEEQNASVLFYNKLFEHRPLEDANVGKGEFLIALLSEFHKRPVGDLEFGNTKLEVKTGKGRIVRGDYKKLNDFVNLVANWTGDEFKPEDFAKVEIPFVDQAGKNILLERFNKDVKDGKKRVQLIGALMLIGYAHHSQGFDYMLTVLQRSQSLKRVKALTTESYNKARYLLIRGNEQNVINECVENNYFIFSFNNSGVHIAYPGSN